MTAPLATLARQAAEIRREIHLIDAERAHVDVPKQSAVEIARGLGLALDPWQRDALESDARNVLLLCSRQAGKSTVAALEAVREAVFEPGSLTLCLAPTERQAKRLLRTIRGYYTPLSTIAPAVTEGVLTLELRNGSEIHALPGKEATIRGFSDVDLLLIDEASRVPDDLYSAVRPMLAISGGRLMALSTPFGKRGWFYGAWNEEGDAWHRAMVTAFDVPRIDRRWLEDERKRIGEWWFQQEYLCQFVDTDDQLYATDLVDAAVSADVALLALPTFRG